jgi:hypothetical protein
MGSDQEQIGACQGWPRLREIRLWKLCEIIGNPNVETFWVEKMVCTALEGL